LEWQRPGRFASFTCAVAVNNFYLTQLNKFYKCKPEKAIQPDSLAIANSASAAV
jgi:hypothetical protein